MPRPARSTPNGVNIHVDGERSAAHLAYEQQTGLTYNRDWQGVLPLQPVGHSGLPRGIITGLQQFMPWVKVIRVPFNKWCFDADGKMHWRMEALLDEARLHGYRVLWVLMDGLSQRGADWTFSPPPPNSTDPAYYTGEMFPQAKANQQEAWTKLLAWLDANPGVVSEGFEAINEPAGYNAANGSGKVPMATCIAAYVDAVLAIWNQIRNRRPGKDFYVSYWRYGATYDEFLNYPLPEYGGRNADQVFRDEIGARLVYSFHSYFGLNASGSKPLQKDMHVQRINQHMQTGVPISVTEVVTRNNHTDLYPWTESDSWSEFARARWHHAAKALRQGSMWWPHMNWAKGFLIRHLNSGGQSRFRNEHMNSYGAAVAMMSFGNHPDFFTGPQSGIKDAASPDSVVRTVTENEAANYQPTYGTVITKLAHIFGGRGHCVLNADPTAKNYLYGGDGRTVINCSDNWDHAYLGRGGGVIRCGGGQAVAVAQDGQSRIYAGPGITRASLWTQTQFKNINAQNNSGVVVAHPTGTLHITYFYPEAGHKVSFRGAFTSATDLLAACRTTPATDGHGKTDLIVDLPTGGIVRFARMGELLGLLHASCPDITDGWYTPGWQEPADYNPADLALPAPTTDQFDWWYETQPNGTVTIVFSRDGAQVGMFSRNGTEVQMIPRQAA